MVPARLLEPPPSMAALTLGCCCYSSSVTIVRRRKTTRTTIIRASISMDDCSSSGSKKKIQLCQLHPGKVNKVYEDRNMGILCYTDENGELVCEGLDEGPRLNWQDMEKLDMAKKTKNQEDQRQRTAPTVGRIDWSNLQAAVSMGKN